jgi:hypothetical protein
MLAQREELARLVQPVLPARLARLEIRETLVQPVTRDRLGHKAFKELLVRLAQLELPDPRDLLVQPELLALLDQPA